MGIKDRINTSKDKVLTGKELLKSTINQYGGNVTSSVPTFQELSDGINSSITVLPKVTSSTELLYNFEEQGSTDRHKIQLNSTNCTTIYKSGDSVKLIWMPTYVDRWSGSERPRYNIDVLSTELLSGTYTSFPSFSMYHTPETTSKIPNNKLYYCFTLGTDSIYVRDSEMGSLRLKDGGWTSMTDHSGLDKDMNKCYRGNGSSYIYLGGDSTIVKLDVSTDTITSISVTDKQPGKLLNQENGYIYSIYNNSLYKKINIQTGASSSIGTVSYSGVSTNKFVVTASGALLSSNKYQEDLYIISHNNNPYLNLTVKSSQKYSYSGPSYTTYPTYTIVESGESDEFDDINVLVLSVIGNKSSYDWWAMGLLISKLAIK